MKIHLLGPSCSGTSTLGKLIAGKYEFPWYDTDDIFWIKTDPPFTKKRERNERINLLKNIFKNDSLVLSGSAMGWGDFIKNDLDIIIYKYVKQEIRIKRLLKREKERYGKRIEFGNDMHELYKEFVAWNKRYETGGIEMRSRESELTWLENIRCKIIKLEGNNPPEDELKKVLEIIGTIK